MFAYWLICFCSGAFPFSAVSSPLLDGYNDPTIRLMMIGYTALMCDVTVEDGYERHFLISGPSEVEYWVLLDIEFE